MNLDLVEKLNVEGKSGETCHRVFANVEQINNCITDIHKASDSISSIAKTMSLVGNETRLKILYLIYKEKKVCVCDLSDIIGVSISAVSQQLKKLKAGGLIEDKKVGKTTFYSINDSSLQILITVFIHISNNKMIHNGNKR